MIIKENMALAPMTTMRTGGSARYFVRAETTEDLSKAVFFAKEKSLPAFILGGGSNTLVPDEGFPGLVIKIEIKGITYEETAFGVRVISGAGEVWDGLVCSVIERGLFGLENLSLIPGTVGGATVQNIGAYGAEIRESILWVEAFDTIQGVVKTFLYDECAFGYRESLFKSNKHLVVTRVAFDLVRDGKPRIGYEDVKKYFMEKEIDLPTLVDTRTAVVFIRTAKMPAPPLGTAGSFFKNPVVSENRLENLKRQFPQIKSYSQGNNTVKLSAAWILDNIGGFRGARRGDAGVSEKQALILVNYGTATTENICTLAREMKNDIKEKINIDLEEEVVLIKVSSAREVFFKKVASK